MTAALEVIDPGLMTTVQDQGRFGHQALGIPVSGALDPDNLAIANSLVGNESNCGALEIRMIGPTFRVRAHSIAVALSGTSGAIEFFSTDTPAGTRIPSHRSLILSNEHTFRICSVLDTAVCYLAVGGGFDLPQIYGSQSTYLPGGFGGMAGRCLQVGDMIPLHHPAVASGQSQELATPHKDDDSSLIRVVLGPQDDHFTTTGFETFLNSPYCVAQQLNRMGMQLEGQPIAHAKGYNIASDGVVKGAIQVPGDGVPIILLADCQTTGGYPKIATVISADLPKLGRMRPGATLRFQSVSVDEAEQLARDRQARLTRLMASISAFAVDELLNSENLISGVVADEL